MGNQILTRERELHLFHGKSIWRENSRGQSSDSSGEKPHYVPLNKSSDFLSVSTVSPQRYALIRAREAMGHRDLLLPDAQLGPCPQAAAVLLLAQDPGHFLIYDQITKQLCSGPEVGGRSCRKPRPVSAAGRPGHRVKSSGQAAPGFQGILWSEQAPSSKPKGPTSAITEVPRCVVTITKGLSQLPSHVRRPHQVRCLTPPPPTTSVPSVHSRIPSWKEYIPWTHSLCSLQGAFFTPIALVTVNHSNWLKTCLPGEPMNTHWAGDPGA